MIFLQQAALAFLVLEAFLVFFIIGQIGFFKTMLCWLAGAALGALLIQRQGMSVLLRLQESLSRRAVPVDDMFDGLCLVVAGLLFLVPGFISDAAAFLLLIPAVRARLRRGNLFGFTAHTAGDPTVIDGAYVRVEEPVEQIEHQAEKTTLPPR